jgi:hypothetical protein
LTSILFTGHGVQREPREPRRVVPRLRGRTLVKYWSKVVKDRSTTGQTMVKYWSKSGQRPVNHQLVKTTPSSTGRQEHPANRTWSWREMMQFAQYFDQQFDHYLTSTRPGRIG